MKLVPTTGVCLVLAWSAASAAPDTVSFDEAHRRLASFEKALRDRASSNEAIGEAMERLLSARRALDPAPDATRDRARLHAAIDKALLRAVALAKVDRDRRSNLRHPVQMRAARALGRSGAGVAPALMRTLERIFKDRDYTPHPAFYTVAFRALVALDPPRALDWFLRKAITAEIDDDNKARTLAAFGSIAGARGLGAAGRRAAFSRIVELFQSFNYHVEADYDHVAGYRGSKGALKKLTQSGVYWADVLPAVKDALRALGTDPRTGRPPLDIDSREEIDTVDRYQTWFALHKWMGRSPWIDGPHEARPRTEPPYTRPLPRTWKLYGAPWTDWWFRHRRIEERVGDPQAAPSRDSVEGRTLRTLLVTALADPEVFVRAAAAVQLGRLDVHGADVLLRERLARDSSATVREAAMLGLALCARGDTRDFLRATVADASESPRVRAYAVLGLGFVKDVEFLRKLAGGAPAPAGDRQAVAELRACALRALAEAGEGRDANLAAALLADASTPPAVRGAAGAAIASLGTPELRQTLMSTLRETRDFPSKRATQCAAAIGLAGAVRADDRPTFRALALRLRNDKGRFAPIRLEICHSLARIGGDEAQRTLDEEYKRLRPRSLRYAERGYLLLALGMTADADKRREFLRAELQGLTHEFDQAACALALALAGDHGARDAIRARLAGARQEFIPHGMMALALLNDRGSVGEIRGIVERAWGGATLREGAAALALLCRKDAVADLLALWGRANSPGDYDSLATAFRLAGSAAAVEPLSKIAGDASRAPRERGFALVALGRLADPERRPRLDRFAFRTNPYGGCATLLDLARYRDAPFLYYQER